MIRNDAAIIAEQKRIFAAKVNAEAKTVAATPAETTIPQNVDDATIEGMIQKLRLLLPKRK